jgi:3-deoxy-D-manno-octulosonic-acid transferase
MAYWVYNLILTLALIPLALALPLFFFLRVRWLEGFADRLSFYAPEKRRLMNGARPIWIHAVSVGEVLSMEALVREVRRKFPERKVLVSSSTATGIDMARKMRVGDATIFFPLDYAAIVRRALRIFDPALVIFLETEIWPNYLWIAHRKGIPVIMLSGRISARSLNRYRLFLRLFGQAVRRFSALGMQSESDAQRMVSLGVDRGKIVITGNLKYEVDGRGSASGNGGRPELLAPAIDAPRQVWVAGSTHYGEETIILEVYQSLKKSFPGLVLVLAPRHPHRFLEVEKLLQRKSVHYVKRSQVEEPAPARVDVLLLDTMGELPAYYARADVTFVGGSFVNVGGHNILEPARLRKPVFFGPYMSNFAEAAREMERQGGGAVVRTQYELARKIATVLSDPGMARAMGDRAHAAVNGHRGGIAESMELVSRYLG